MISSGQTPQQGAHRAAVDAILRRASAGDMEALFQKALWELAGAPLARDLPAARASLQRAAASGHQDAALIDIALTANGSGSTADWPKARLLLEKLAATDDIARHMLSLLNDMQLAPDGSPVTRPAAEIMCPDGSIQRIRQCLSPAECAHVANAAGDLLAPAIVVDPTTGRSVPHPIRTSDSATLSPLREDLVVRAINRRIAAWSDTSIDQGEALTILRYQPGQQFRLHSDALPNVRNQRVKTVLLYLNDGYRGGETIFPEFNLTITPSAGDAIIFTNTLPDGRINARMRHAGLPVRSGVKWLATRWIRARPFDVWVGPEQA